MSYDAEDKGNLKHVAEPETNKFFEVISDFLDCLVVILDKEGKIAYCNKFSEKITGIPQEQVKGRYYWDIFCLPEEKELYKVFFDQLAPDAFPFELKTQITAGMGSNVTILWKYNNLLEQSKSNQDDEYLVLTGIDITSYDDANKKLQEIGEKYRTLIHVSPVSVISLDNDYRIKSWSSAAEKLLGWTEKSVLEKSLFQVLGGKNERLKESCERALQGGITNDLELNCYRKDGTPVSVSLYLAPTRDYNGIVDGIVLIALDITERKQAEVSLNYQLAVEKLIADISSYLANLPSKQVSEGINEILKMLGEFLQADRGYVFQFSEDMATRTMTHEWCADNIEDLKECFHNQSLDELSWWKNKLVAREWIRISDIQELPPEAGGVKREVEAQKVKSYICVPLVIEGSLFGAFGFDSIEEKRKWAAEHAKLLSVVAELIANAFARYSAYLEISYMSFHDQLTGLYNRHFLKEEMKRMDNPDNLPLSIIVADLNGLKLVNDTYGHIMGDELLHKAASLLKQSCREEDVIARWGGDEFIILLPRTSKKKAKVIQNRIVDNCTGEYAGDVPVSIAVGVACKNNTANGLHEILKKAEDSMYSQKLTESRSVRNAVLSTLMKTLSEKSYETETHTHRMKETARMIGETAGLSEADLKRLDLLITLHDIGNINIPEETLMKTGPLTSREWEMIKKHPETGFRIARSTEDYAHVAEEILSHHESWDGSGYPRGLKGEEIPLLSRILAIADAYEVMSSGRPYKKQLSRSEIKSELRRCSGTQFDPGLAGLFLSMLE